MASEPPAAAEESPAAAAPAGAAPPTAAGPGAAAPPGPPARTPLWLLAVKLVLELLGTAVLGVVFAVLWVFSTENAGIEVLLELAKPANSILAIERHEGRLTGPLTLYNIHYRDQFVDVKVARLYLDWQPADLLVKRVRVLDAQADDVQYQTLAEKPARKKGTNSNLPFQLRVERLLVTGFHQKNPDGSALLDLDRALAGLNWQGKNLSVRAPDIRVPAQKGVPIVGAWRMDLAARLEGDRIALVPLILNERVAGGLRAELKGTIGLVGKVPNDFTVRWQNLRWPLTTPPVLVRGPPGPAGGPGPGPAGLAPGTTLVIRTTTTSHASGTADTTALAARQAADAARRAESQRGAPPIGTRRTTTQTVTVPAGTSPAAHAAAIAQASGATGGTPGGAVPAPGTAAAPGPRGAPPRESGLAVAPGDAPAPAITAGPDQVVASRQGALVWQGRPDAWSFRVQADALARGYGIALTGAGTGTTETVTLKNVQVALTRAGSRPVVGRASAEGSLRFKAPLGGAGRVVLQNFDPAAFVAGAPGRLNGVLTARTVQDARAGQRIDFGARFDNTTLRGIPLKLALDGHYLAQAKTVQIADLDLLLGTGGKARVQRSSGRIKGAATLTLAPVTARGRLTLTDVNPGIFVPQAPGRLNGSVTADTRMDPQGRPLVTFSADLANSALRGYPLALSTLGRFRGADKTLAFDRLRLVSGPTTVVAKGRVYPTLLAQATVNSTNLNSLLPSLRGALDAEVKAAGPLAAPTLDVHATGTGLAYGELGSLGSVRLDARGEASLNSRQPFRVELVARDLAAAGQRFDTLNVSAQGTIAHHVATVSFVAPPGAAMPVGRAAVRLAGGFEPGTQRWAGRLESASVAVSRYADWTLAGPVALDLSPRRQVVGNACFVAAARRLCASLERDGAVLNARFEAARLPFADAIPFLPDTVKAKLILTGELSGHGRVRLAGTTLEDFDVDLVTSSGQVGWQDAITLPFAPITLKTTGGADAIRARLDAPFAGAPLTADVTLTGTGPFPTRRLGGSAHLTIADVTRFAPPNDAVRDLRGRVEANLRFGGTPKTPELGGTATLADARIGIVAPNLILEDVQGQADFSMNGPMTFRLSAKSGTGARTSDDKQTIGDGSLTITGRIDPMKGLPTLEMIVAGNGALLYDTKVARVYASPALRLVPRPGGGLSLTGRVDVPVARITPQPSKGQINASADQVFVGEDASQPLQLFAVVQVVLGDDVRVSAYGANARLGGSLTVNDAPSRITTAKGAIILEEGSFSAYGQSLVLRDGRLSFNGPITNPSVDIRAERPKKPQDDLVVGVRVRGSLNAPQFDTYSNQSMSRDEQLSALLLGRKLDSSDGSKFGANASASPLGGGSSQNQATAGLAALGGGLLAGKFSSLTGLNASVDSVQNFGGSLFQNGQQDQTRLSVGRYLSPRLYVSYGINLFQQGYAFRLAYTLGRGFKAVVEQGSLTSGGDLTYARDRDPSPDKNGNPSPMAAPKPAGPIQPLPLEATSAIAPVNVDRAPSATSAPPPARPKRAPPAPTPAPAPAPKPRTESRTTTSTTTTDPTPPAAALKPAPVPPPTLPGLRAEPAPPAASPGGTPAPGQGRHRGAASDAGASDDAVIVN